MASRDDCPGTLRSKSRRSWFDAPPLTTLDPQQRAEQISKQPRPQHKSPDSVETLTLSHFTSAPRLSFGKVILGKTKFRNLLIRNPHDYEQEVIIERFPFKKKFSTEQTRFTVYPNEVFDLEILWRPEEETNVREMILFHINDVYRLQAYVFGSSEKPKAQRKVRRGHLGPRVRQPVSVVQTPALSRIMSSYDRSSLEAPVYGGVTKSEASKPVRINTTEDLQRQHTSTLRNVATVQKQRQAEMKENVENLNPGEDIHCTPFPLESTSVEEKLNEDLQSCQRKSMSDITSPSLNTMSPIPVIGEIEKGFIIDSYFKNNETASDAPKPAGTKSSSTKPNVDMKETFVCFQALSETVSTQGKTFGTVVLEKEPSDEKADLKTGAGKEISSKAPFILKDESILKNQCLRADDVERKVRKDWSSPQLSQGSTILQNSVSPNTQLNQSLNLISQMNTPLRGNRNTPQDADSSNVGFISQGYGLVSPNTFLEDMNSLQISSGKRSHREEAVTASKQQRSHGGQDVEIPSPSRIMNNSIPHDILVDHLHNIQANLNNSASLKRANTPLRIDKPQRKRRSITSRFRQKEKQKLVAGTNDSSNLNTREPMVKNKTELKLNQMQAKQIDEMKIKRKSISSVSITPKRGATMVTKKTPGRRKSGGKKKSPGNNSFRYAKFSKTRKSPQNQYSTKSSSTKQLKLDVKPGTFALQSPISLDCSTPPTKTSFIDDRTVVKQKSFDKGHTCITPYSTVSQDCPTPPTKSFLIDNHTIIKQQSFHVKENSNDDKSTCHADIYGRRSNSSKNLFPDEIHDDFTTKTEISEQFDTNTDFNNLMKEEIQQHAFAIDRKEIFIDKAGNIVYNYNAMQLTGTSQLLNKYTIMKNGQMIYVSTEPRSVWKGAEKSNLDVTGTDSISFSSQSSYQLHTPTQLPEIDPQLSRRSTHIVRDPKFIDIASMHQKYLNFDLELKNDLTSPSGKPDVNPIDQSCSSKLKVFSTDILEDTKPYYNEKVKDSAKDNVDSIMPHDTSMCSEKELRSPLSDLGVKMNNDSKDSFTTDSLNQSQSHASSFSEGNRTFNTESELPGNVSALSASSKNSDEENEEQLSMKESPESQDFDSRSAMASIERKQSKHESVNLLKYKDTCWSVNELCAPEAHVSSRIAEDSKFSDTGRDCCEKTKSKRRSISTGDLPSCLSQEMTQTASHLNLNSRKSVPESEPDSESVSDTFVRPPPVLSQNNRKAHKVNENSIGLATDAKVKAKITTMNSSTLSMQINEDKKYASETSSDMKIKNMSHGTGVSMLNSIGFRGRSQSVDCLKSDTGKKVNRNASTTMTMKRSQSSQQGKMDLGGLPMNQRKTSSKSVKGIAQSKLILIKKPKTALPRHPMPFAARNMYYDERWKEKQERGFVQWLNFVLTPPDEYVAVTTRSKVDAGTVALTSHHVAPRLAPTKEILSFRTYAAQRRLNRLRRAACELYHSEKMITVIQKLEIEVESKRILVRKDKMIHADLGIKQKLLDMLLQYSSLWLRIGLETVFGEIIVLHSNADIIGLSRFIVTRLLGSPDIAQEFAHPTVPHLYKDGYAAALSRHTLKKFLLLVFFLDQAKTSKLIDHDPCLFCKDAVIKSSKEILIEFSRDTLSGEGDLVRHLAYLGYNVHQIQKPIDEFDYAVTNISTDLKDGLRLSRVVELLANDTCIIRKLRVPAISRLQKIHNTEVFFNAMKEHGLDLVTDKKLSARDIVDGHREKTLRLLWLLILHFQANIQVNEEHLQEEINLLTKSLQLKLAMQKIGVFQFQDSMARRDSGQGQSLSLTPRMQLIFRWCQLVCLHYGVKIENFTVSFSDGRAFCCLLHHYHPVLLPQSDIHFETTLSLQADNTADFVNDGDDSNLSFSGRENDMLQNEVDPVVFQRLLCNEKANFKTLYEKVSALGGVPLMVKSTDMSNTIPDEKVVSTYIAYLCARLLDIREEVKAARVIQMAWRRKKLHRDFLNRQNATRILQKHWRKYLAVKHLRNIHREKDEAATVIQKCWRGRICFKKFGGIRNSAISIQKCWRGYKARKQFENLKKERVEKAVNAIQSYYRSCLVRQSFLNKRQAAVRIQRYWRAFVMEQKERMKREEDLKLRKERTEAALILQRYTRGWLCRKKLQQMRKSAVCVQKWWRGHTARKFTSNLRFELYNRSAIVIQKWVRRMICDRNYEKTRSSILLLQRQWRKVLAQKQFKVLWDERTEAAVIFQKNFRSKVLYEKFKRIKRSALSIQSFWRGYKARVYADVLRKERNEIAATVIQKTWRAFVQNEKFKKMKISAIYIQSFWRGYTARVYADVLRKERNEKAATVIQKTWRAFVQNEKFKKMKISAIYIQSFWRGYTARVYADVLRKERNERAATVIQKTWRAFVTYRGYVRMRKAAIIVQKCCRQKLACREVELLRSKRKEEAAINIQRYVRSFIAQRQFLRMKKASIVIQSNWRMHRAIQQLQTLKAERDERCAALIQSFWRQCYERQIFLQQEESRRNKFATVIQAWVRRMICTKNYQRTKSSILLLQRQWRMVLAWKQFKILLKEKTEAAVILQKVYRSKVLYQKFQSMKRSAICIQSFWRGYKARVYSDVLRRARNEKAATVIQKTWRAFVTYRGYVRMRKAAIIVQKCCRRRLACREVELLRSKRKEEAAIKIQSNIKCFIAQRNFQQIRKASLVIQRFWRMNRAIHQLHTLKTERDTRCAVLIQTVWRGFCERERFLQKKCAAITVQSYWRMFSQRKQFNEQRMAALVIQRRYREWICALRVRGHYLRVRNSVVFLQSLVRGKRVFQEYQAKREATIILQSYFRMYKRRIKFLALRLATVIIQRSYRNYHYGNLVRQQYLSLKQSAIVIQRTYRKYLDLKANRREKSSIILQASVRRFLAKKRFQEQRTTAVIIQRKFHANQAMRKSRDEFVRMKNAAITIQSVFRGLLAQRTLNRLKKINCEREESAVKIQSAFKRFLAVKKYKEKREAIVVLQRWFRGVCVMRQEQLHFAKCRSSIVKIQSIFRMHLARVKYNQKYQAVICLQSFARRLKAENDFHLTRNAAIVLQFHYRDWRKRKYLKIEQEKQIKALQERRIKLQHHAAVIVQRAFRRYIMVKNEREEMAAVKIQAIVRQYLARKRYLNTLHSILLIQACFRGYKTRKSLISLKRRVRAVRLIQARTRGYLVRKRILPLLQERIMKAREIQMRHRSATKIQALWRGFTMRRNITNKRLKQARKRVEDVNRSATEEKTLGYRTASALDYLFRDKDLAFILEALIHLEVATRLSPVCCERVVEVNAVSILFQLIHSCNRSIPHMEIIKYSLDIILNLSKYHKTVDSILVVTDAPSIILELLQIYREKNQIFLKICHLLGILAVDSNRKQIIMGCERIQERLQSIHSLVLRKHRSNQSHQLAKAKMTAMKSFNSTLPLSAQFTTPNKRRQPCPEWNLKKNKPKDFEDPLSAISHVLNMFRIGPKI